MSRVIYIRDLPKAPKHLTFDFGGDILAVSCTDGIIYLYNSFRTGQPQLVKRLDGLINALEADSEASSAVAWHPDDRAFAFPTPTRDIQVFSHKDWERQRSFKSGHSGDITALAWSPNGALLASAGADSKLVIWEATKQGIISTHENIGATILSLQWHPVSNTLSYTNSEGELYIHTDIVPNEHVHLLEKSLVAAPFIHDPLAEVSGNARRVPMPPAKADGNQRQDRHETPDSLDDILESDQGSDLEGFVEDDDGAGYGEVNGNGKRPRGHAPIGRSTKRHAAASSWEPQVHQSFQPGSTPWRGNRRYLCLNLTGFIWTVDQDTHHSVTIEFYDRDFERDIKFTDTFRYDKACLGEKGALFASSPRENEPGVLFYRPHQHWTSERSDWRTTLPEGESVTSLALSDSYVVATTSANYIRVYTLFGTPFRIYRLKSSPTVACTAWRDYVMTVGNGPVGADGSTRLHYSIENVKREETCQNEDVVALTDGATLQNVFFSDSGDPCIYDSTGVLLVLLHWRTPGQARWTPILDTRLLERLASGRKDETYWPVAVAEEKFYCIILKGGEKYPYFPRPLLNEFELRIPLDTVFSRQRNGGSAESKALEEVFVRSSIMHGLHEDLVSNTSSTHEQRVELSNKQLSIDKALLQLLAAECIEGEEKGMKALEIASLMRDTSGRMLEAAGKVAARYGHNVLGDKIRELAERRLVGLDDETTLQ